MKKVIYSILSVLFIVVLVACGSSHPWVGEWMPSNDTSGTSVTSIKSNGTVELVVDTDDGYARIDGSWSQVPNTENQIKITFDPNSIELDFDNPLTEMIVAEVVKEKVKESGVFVVKNDGNRLENVDNSMNAFVRKD